MARQHSTANSRHFRSEMSAPTWSSSEQRVALIHACSSRHNSAASNRRRRLDRLIMFTPAVCRGTRGCGSCLFENEIDDPAPPNMETFTAAVVQDVFVLTTSVLKCVCQNRHQAKVAR